MKASRLFVFILVFLVHSALAVENIQQIVQLDLKHQSAQIQKALFELGLDITAVDRTNQKINVLVSEKEIEKIKQIGLKPTVLVPDANELARQIRASGYLDNFMNYETIVQKLEEWTIQYPNLAKLEDIGDTYDKIHGRGGYDIWAIKISDNVQVEENEPEVFIMANLHAREIITPEIVMYFMDYVFTNYGSDPYVTYLVDNRQIWIVPSTNPDGHEYVMTGVNPKDRTYADPFWWRKNMQDNNNNGRFDPEYDGVDLNRNFGYKWGLDNIGSSGNPSSGTYRGSGPFSEPESQVIRDFTLAHNFIISISYHSYSQLWLYPWGYAHENSPDHEIFVALADCCVAYNGYTPQIGADLYPVNGDTDDWFYGEQTTKNKIFAFTPEVGNTAESIGGWTGFFPDTLYIEKQIIENQGPIFYLLYAAGEEPIIEPQLFPDTENASGPYETMVTVRQPLVLTNAAPIVNSSVKLFYNTAGKEAPFDSTTLTPTAAAELFLASIPTQGDEVTVYYYFAAHDQLGRIGHAPRMAPYAVYSFSVGADQIPPEIVHSPLPDQNSRAKLFEINAEIRDNGGIQKALVFYSHNFGPVDSLEMTAIDGTDSFRAVIEPENTAPGDFFDYKIVARDVSRNINTATAPDFGFYRFRILPGILFDFEDNNGGFVNSSPGDWAWGVPTSGPRIAHSGVNVWATNLSWEYSNNSNSKLDTPPIDLTGCSRAYLSFWHWYENETSSSLWDGGNVKISVNEGPFEMIYPVDGYDGIIDEFNTIIGGEPAFGGEKENGNFWHEEIFDLNEFLGNEIKIRFHFGSDNNTTMAGWYLDDVEFLLLPSGSPVIYNVSALPNTSDHVGPYPVQATISDDDGIKSAFLWFSTDKKETFTQISMQSVGEDIFQANIPGQPYETAVFYYLTAIDNVGNTASEPTAAPENGYSFWVTERKPAIEIVPERIDINLQTNTQFSDSIAIFNQGLLVLEFTIVDSLVSSPVFAQTLPTQSVTRGWAEISGSIQQALNGYSGRMKDFRTENQSKTEAISIQQFDDPAETHISSDLRTLRVQMSPKSLKLNLNFAAEKISREEFAIVSLNIDQKTTTGTSITSLAGADYHLIWDFGNSFRLPASSAILVTDDFSRCLGTVPLEISATGAMAEVPRAALGEFDGNFDLAVISFSENNGIFDRLPDEQNVTFGLATGVPWLLVEPNSAQIPGEGVISISVSVNAEALEPGNYDVLLIIQSNDPNHPEVQLPVKVTVTGSDGIEVTQQIPENYQLMPNFPNPFNPATTIKYQLPETAAVNLKVFNVKGQLVRSLVQVSQGAGMYEVVWDGKNEFGELVSSGVYLIQFTAGDFRQARKILFLQ